MEQNQKSISRLKWSKNVASTLRDDLPRHRITLRVEDETSCSTSHFYASQRRHEQIIIERELKFSIFPIFQKFWKKWSNFASIRSRATSYRSWWNFACASVIPNYIDEKIFSRFECMEQTQKFKFLLPSIFSIFPKFLRNFTSPFTLAITYRPEMSIAQIKALDEISPEMK